ncbi:hypothetical protein BDV25DRAFT_128923 [Aspergillus avenaceus]|uniref:FAD-binding PCMH-type domain-containing protein n=1 Tax=Aspergillus avenaceus TaxID=36643 RepID=A0A5N6TY43_ASPAV|nr:hypothetical protein BDV25DRAFT_128923 [Aspergillus avenaceus]
MTRYHILITLGLLGLGQARTPTCRCFPDEPCWPSPEEWDAFNHTIGGRLIRTTPISSVCHTNTSFNTYNARSCSELLTNWEDPRTHYDTSSSPMAAWFGNYSCTPFSPPCTLGPLVRYAVKVSNVDDVRATLNFTTTHNIRLVIRNTGHDYLGKSTGAGAVALWTHHLTHTQTIPDYTSAVYSGPALRLGAGVQGSQALSAAQSSNHTLVTGNCPSVGIAGGYTQGGGHGQLVSLYGLAADQVLEWEVVTATGDWLVASSTQHEDLFWALSGGGGGTYAVVMSVLVKMYPELRTVEARLAVSSTVPGYWDVVGAALVDTMPLVDRGGVVVWNLGREGFSLAPVALPGGTVDMLQGYLGRTLELLKRKNVTYEYTINTHSTFYKSYQATNPHLNITDYQIGGRLLPRSTIDNNPSLLPTFQEIVAFNTSIAGVSLNVSRGRWPSNAVNPVWREAGMAVVLGLPYSRVRETDLQRQVVMTNELVPRLEALAPGSGAYLNEADFNEPDWRRVFYGVNYQRLLAVKEKYDPFQVFYGLTAVGSEGWVVSGDGRLCRV